MSSISIDTLIGILEFDESADFEDSWVCAIGVDRLPYIDRIEFLLEDVTEPSSNLVLRLDNYLKIHDETVPKLEEAIINDYRSVERGQPDWLDFSDVERGLSNDRILDKVGGRITVLEWSEDVKISFRVPWDTEHGLRLSVSASGTLDLE